MVTPRSRLVLSFLCLCAIASAEIGDTIPTIKIEGRRFIETSSGKPFFIKGVDYQPGGESGVGTGNGDPLSNVEECKRDAYLFQQLNINTIRVYSISPDEDHDECMSVLAQAGIYVLLDVNSPLGGQHINRIEPWTTYNTDYLDHILSVVDQFSGYNNTLGFFAGNEIVNNPNSAFASSPYIRGVLRDLKSYISSHSARPIPVGYSAADDLTYRVSLPTYLTCSEESMENIDFYGVNSYQWCGHQDLHSSGYDQLIDDYTNATVPVMLSEYGCNLVYPRLFEETKALYEPEMTKVFSGGLVYEFTQGANGFGLVDVNGDKSVRPLPDFYTLSNMMAKLQNSLEDSLSEPPKPPPDDERCLSAELDDIHSSLKTPACPNCGLVSHGFASNVSAKRGKFVDVSSLSSKYNVIDSDGSYIEDPSIVPIYSLGSVMTSTDDDDDDFDVDELFDNVDRSELPHLDVTKASSSKKKSSGSLGSEVNLSFTTVLSLFVIFFFFSL